MPDYKDREFILLADSKEICQKKLNQWRHIYDLDIISSTAVQGIIYIILTRRRFDA